MREDTIGWLHASVFALAMALLSASASGRALSRHQHHAERAVQGWQLAQSQGAHGLSLVELEGTEEASAPGQQRAGLLMASAGDSTAGAGPPMMEQPMQRAGLRGVPTLGLVAALADEGASASGDPSKADNNNSQATDPACGTNHSSSSSSSSHCCCSRSTIRSPGESPSALVPVVLSMGGLAPTAPAGSSSGLLDSSSNSSASSSARLAVQPPLPQHSLPLQAGTAEQVAAVGVPERCIVAGSALFSSCSVEISGAQAYFNITVHFLAPQNYTQLLHDRGYTRAQVLSYMQEALAKPSNACCAAQCCFNQVLLCDCEASVLQVAVRFAGADESFYSLMISQLARSCGIKHFYGASCPDSLAVPASATACIAGTAWPPVISGQAAAEPVQGHVEDGTAAAASPGDAPTVHPVCVAEVQQEAPRPAASLAEAAPAGGEG